MVSSPRRGCCESDSSAHVSPKARQQRHGSHRAIRRQDHIRSQRGSSALVSLMARQMTRAHSQKQKAQRFLCLCLAFFVWETAAPSTSNKDTGTKEDADQDSLPFITAQRENPTERYWLTRLKRGTTTSQGDGALRRGSTCQGR